MEKALPVHSRAGERADLRGNQDSQNVIFPLHHGRMGWWEMERHVTGFTAGAKAGPIYSHPQDHIGQHHKSRTVTSQDDSDRRGQDREALAKGWAVIKPQSK